MPSHRITHIKLLAEKCELENITHVRIFALGHSSVESITMVMDSIKEGLEYYIETRYGKMNVTISINSSGWEHLKTSHDSERDHLLLLPTVSSRYLKKNLKALKL